MQATSRKQKERRNQQFDDLSARRDERVPPWAAGRSRSSGSRTRRTGRSPSLSAGEGCSRRPTSSLCSATRASASSSSPAPARCSSTAALPAGSAFRPSFLPLKSQLVMHMLQPAKCIILNCRSIPFPVCTQQYNFFVQLDLACRSFP
jgi:hypothetical protein